MSTQPAPAAMTDDETAAFAEQVEGERLACFRVVEVETQYHRFAALQGRQLGDGQFYVAVEFLGLQLQLYTFAG